LPVAQQQVVEIVKALSTDARVLAMDEPTAALADHEVELLYSLVQRLCACGIAVLYVSHRLREVFDLSSRITVLKDGPWSPPSTRATSPAKAWSGTWWAARSSHSFPPGRPKPTPEMFGSRCVRRATVGCGI
jgi:ABC-type sugar transport system ATPase subunit